MQAFSPFQKILQMISVDAENAPSIQPLNGKSLVYVMTNASLFDYLLMNALCLQLDLPPPVYANDVPWLSLKRFLFSAIFRRPAFRHRTECRILVDKVRTKEPIVLFLGRTGIFSRSLRWNHLIWEELLRGQKKDETDIRFLPVSLIWGRRPERVQRTFIDLTLGDLSAPGFIRKVITLLRHPKGIRLKTGTPIDLATFNENTRSTRDELRAKKLRRFLSSYLYRERKLITGPIVRRKKRIIEVLLKDPELKDLVRGVARREKKTEEEIWKRARKILQELVSAYNRTIVALSYIGFNWLWNRLYHSMQVDEVGLKRLKSTATNYPTILVPSHKSHMDYMLLSAIFYENDMMPPHIAAGVNLAFWPMATIFRANGAYFIRRKISGDLLYARLLFQYVRWLIRTGYSQEFFIEGGRSRTGRLLYPKHGLLSMQVDAFLDGLTRDLFVIPISVTYEKIPEESSYAAELSGAEKERENVWALFKARKLLRRTHGTAYVRFGEPISLKAYFHCEEGQSIPSKTRHSVTQELAKDIVRSIASETMVTVSSLVATAFLGQLNLEVSKTELGQRIDWLRILLRKMKAPLSPDVNEEIFDLSKALQFFKNNHWIKPSTHSLESFIVPNEKRVALDFYKNTILHYLLPVLFKAIAKDSLQNVEFLRGLFAHEFLIPESMTAQKLMDMGSEALQGDHLGGSGPFLQSLIDNYFEAYDLAARATLEMSITQSPLPKSVMKQVLEMGRRDLQTLQIKRQESVTTENIKIAFHYFHEKELLIDKTALARWYESFKEQTSGRR